MAGTSLALTELGTEWVGLLVSWMCRLKEGGTGSNTHHRWILIGFFLCLCACLGHHRFSFLMLLLEGVGSH